MNITIRTTTVFILLFAIGSASMLIEVPVEQTLTVEHHETEPERRCCARASAELSMEEPAPEPMQAPEEGCVFQTVFEAKDLKPSFYLPPNEDVSEAIQEGLDWLIAAQQETGGFGAGSYYNQRGLDPHAVEADPATTSMVAMAILRDGSNLEHGRYKVQLTNATDYLLKSVEQCKEEDPNITTQTGTQIQMKLGAYIDVVLTTQYLANLLSDIDEGQYRVRVEDAVAKCVRKIESNQEGDGSIAGAGWAGVLQSSFAANALEAAQVQGVSVDGDVLEAAQAYNRDNFDAQSGTVATDKAAGVMLYSISSSTRNAGKKAREAKRLIAKAKEDGLIEEDEVVSVENLTKIGLSADEAAETTTSYEVYEASKVQAQDDNVLIGFGNNGGEEFLSFLQTGEGMIISEDIAWQDWYASTSERLIEIQNENGSWSGHHCITSPVFCTATALLTLSVNNDIDELVAQGQID